MKTLADIQGDPQFAALPRTDQASVLEHLKPGFTQLAPADQDSVIQHLTGSAQASEVPDSAPPLQAHIQKQVSIPEGVGNILGAIGGGIADTAKAAVNPQTYSNLASGAMHSLQTEVYTRQAEAAGTLPDPSHFGRPNALDLAGGGLRNLVNGVTSLPGQVGAAYQGQSMPHNDLEIPASDREQYLRQNYPASMFVGDQLPYAVPLSNIGEAGNIGRIAAEGAAIGALQDSPDGLKGRAGNAVLGAAIPAGLGKVGEMLHGHVEANASEPPIGVNQIRQQEIPSNEIQQTGIQQEGQSSGQEIQGVQQERPVDGYDDVQTIQPQQTQKAGFVKNVQKAKLTEEPLRQGLEQTYEKANNKETLKAAQAKIEADPERAYDEVKNTEEPTHETYAMAQDLMRRYQNEGNFDRAIEIAEHVAERATKQGQAIQALSMWGRLTPEGALVAAERIATKAGKGESKPAVKKLINAVDRFKETADAKAARAIRTLAQKTSKASFKKALSKLSQAELDALGRMVGC